jgi:hypothetical protein
MHWVGGRLDHTTKSDRDAGQPHLVFRRGVELMNIGSGRRPMSIRLLTRYF